MAHAAWLSPDFERYMVRDGTLGIALVAPRTVEGTSGSVELGLGFGPVMDRARIGSLCVGAS